VSLKHGNMRAAIAALAAAAALAGPGAAIAAACPKTSLADVEDEVMCPVCGTPLALATEAPQAKRERAFILDRIERCESKDEIKAALAAEFGDEVLATPEDEGFGLAAYLVPGLALLVGAGAVAFALVRWRRRPRRAETAREGAPPEAGARLEADLRRYDL
jgi:cytochrome c-type biogenesis protein CcmH